MKPTPKPIFEIKEHPNFPNVFLLWQPQGEFIGEITGKKNAEKIRNFLNGSHDELLEDLKYIVSKEPIDGSKEYACTYCDMGGAGYSSKGDGHHDDVTDLCPVLKAQKAIEKASEK